MSAVDNFHRKLLGNLPSDRHASFYEAGARGFNEHGFNEEDFLATFVLALGFAKRGPVVIATPKVLERKVLGAITDTSKKILRRYKGKVQFVKDFTDRVKKLRLATRHLRTDEEPELWVSIGLGEEDPIPDWIRGKLWPTKS